MARSRARPTFSANSPDPTDVAFLSDALKAYRGQVLVFDHPTLSVSPFLNALDLGRRLAGTTGWPDVIAHSRGGLVTQWWLEVFGDALAGTQVRAVLAGAPLRGHHLASPARIQPFLSVLSNIGHYVGQSLNLAAAANPFALASLALLRFFGQRERNRWGLPPIDGIGSRPGTHAAVAVIPGLQGQSAVGTTPNSRDYGPQRASQHAVLRVCGRLRARAHRLETVEGDFRVRRSGQGRREDASSRVQRSGRGHGPHDHARDGRDITDVTQFLAKRTVHHCNYFRQDKTLESLRKWLEVR